MFGVILNIVLSAAIISITLWVSKSSPTIGGFILSLPISTLITLALSKLQNDDAGNTLMLAKSVFIAVPLTLVFFVPFLIAEKLKLTFWASYALGFGLLTVSYGVHAWIMANWTN